MQTFNRIKLTQKEVLLILSNRCDKFEKTKSNKTLFMSFFEDFIEEQWEDDVEMISLFLKDFDDIVINLAVVLDKDTISESDYNKLLEAYKNNDVFLNHLKLECGSFHSIGSFNEANETCLVWRKR